MYLDNNLKECVKDVSIYYKITSLDSNYCGYEQIFYWTGHKFLKKNIVNGSYYGPVIWWYKNGQKAKEGGYKNGLLEGNYVEWYPTGKIKAELLYEKGVGNENAKYYDESGTLIYYLIKVDKYPLFLKTNNDIASFAAIKTYLTKNAQLYKLSKEKKIYGIVNVYYTITEQGKVADVIVYNSLNYFLDKEAIRIIKNMPKFIPAVKDGKNVRVRMLAQIEFK